MIFFTLDLNDERKGKPCFIYIVKGFCFQPLDVDFNRMAMSIDPCDLVPVGRKRLLGFCISKILQNRARNRDFKLELKMKLTAEPWPMRK